MHDNDGFPVSADMLTAPVLSDYLRKSGHLGKGKVVDVEASIIGTGKMGDNARVVLSFEGDAGYAPATLIAKFPAADEQARAMAGLQGAYYAEVMFYRVFADRTRMRTPEIFASEISEDKTSFLLLMEDMSPAEPGSQVVGESRERSGLALAEAAKLAAAFYGDESIGTYDHIWASARDDGGAFGQSMLEEQWPQFVDRFGHGLSADCLAFGERYISAHSHFVSRYTGPKTLAHGDFRSENILFTKDQATTVDWQTPSESSVMTDAAYFLGGSVDVEDRRTWEKGLIEDYRVALADLGVELAFQDCWDQYREYAMHGLMITILGASFSQAEERGDRMFLTMIQRHLQHCVDVNAGEFLS